MGSSVRGSEINRWILSLSAPRLLLLSHVLPPAAVCNRRLREYRFINLAKGAITRTIFHFFLLLDRFALESYLCKILFDKQPWLNGFSEIIYYESRSEQISPKTILAYYYSRQEDIPGKRKRANKQQFFLQASAAGGRFIAETRRLYRGPAFSGALRSQHMRPRSKEARVRCASFAPSCFLAVTRARARMHA